ncbi:hypothetical protein ACF0H5_008924 [Mactra antiquata]
MVLKWVLISSIVVLSNGFDSTKLWKIPPPMKGLKLPMLNGKWYVTYRHVSCSWAGSQVFSDLEVFLSTKSQKIMTISRTIRQNGICNIILSESRAALLPGTFLSRELLGNQLEGLEVVLSTDYKTYLIMVGCDRKVMSGNGCEDGYISVRTRMPHPNKVVKSRINKVLMKHYGTTVDQLLAVTHDRPCKKQPVVCMNGNWW